MESPLVTIITISFNSALTIERAIKSVLSQKYALIEYLIIDGKSTDNTIDIIRKHENGIAHWVSEPDGGIYDAMNKGLEMAHGDIIGILNSDDAFHSANVVEKVVEKYLAIGKECVIHGNIIYHEQNGLHFTIKPLSDESRVKYEPTFLHPAMFVSKVLYNQYGKFNTKYKIAADFDIMQRFYLKGVEYVYIDTPFVDMFAGGESDKKRFRGFVECYKISISSGFPTLFAMATLIKRCVKVSIYSLLKIVRKPSRRK